MQIQIKTISNSIGPASKTQLPQQQQQQKHKSQVHGLDTHKYVKLKATIVENWWSKTRVSISAVEASQSVENYDQLNDWQGWGLDIQA